MYARMYVCMYVCAYVCTHVCRHMRVYINIYMYVYVYIYIYIFIYIYMCVCVCACRCVFMYIRFWQDRNILVMSYGSPACETFAEFSLHRSRATLAQSPPTADRALQSLPLAPGSGLGFGIGFWFRVWGLGV